MHMLTFFSFFPVFNTSDFPTTHSKLSKGVVTEPETCQYRGYRTGPNDKDPYSLSTQYWIVFGARLLFVVMFEVSSNLLSFQIN